MSAGDTQDAVFYALALLLPLSALVARRLPVGQMIKMALAWLAIFAMLFAAFWAFKHWNDKPEVPQPGTPAIDVARIDRDMVTTPVTTSGNIPLELT